jgi:subfamily B ATP-binding cassette protein MsbA
VNGASPRDETASLIRWTMAGMRPYRGRVIAVGLLLLLQVALGALEPWPLKIVIDYVLGQHDLPSPLREPSLALTGGSTVALLVLFVLSGVVLQLIHQLASAIGVRLQTDTGQRMVYDLRKRLLDHLQALGLHHHITSCSIE